MLHVNILSVFSILYQIHVMFIVCLSEHGIY